MLVNVGSTSNKTLGYYLHLSRDSWIRKTWLLNKCLTVDDTYTAHVDILATSPHVSLKVRLVTVSELLHVEEVCNLLRATFGHEWTQLVGQATAGDPGPQDVLVSSVTDILTLDSDPESIWRERKRWFHIPNPPCDCSLPVSASSCTCDSHVAKWNVVPLQGGWYRASINTYPYRRVRGLSIDAENVAGGPVPPVMVSLAHWTLPASPLTGWTHTRKPGSPALCGSFTNAICRKYGRQRNAQKPTRSKQVMFEYSGDIDKQIWRMPENA